jgi:hypothetical protein
MFNKIFTIAFALLVMFVAGTVSIAGEKVHHVAFHVD